MQSTLKPGAAPMTFNKKKLDKYQGFIGEAFVS